MSSNGNGVEKFPVIRRRLQKLDEKRKSLDGRTRELDKKLQQMRFLLDDYVSRYDFSPVGSVNFSPDGRIQALNLTAAKMIGRARSALIGKQFKSFLAKQDRAKFAEYLKGCSSGKETARRMELQLHGERKPVHVELLALPVTDGSQSSGACRVTLVDVSRRVAMEQALQDNEQRYRKLVDLLPDAVWVHSHGRFLLANPATLELFGVKKQGDIIGRNIVDFFHSKARPEVKKRLASLRAGTLKMPYREERQLHLNQGIVDVEMSAAEFEYGGMDAVMVIGRDIGMRKRAEALMRQADERFSKAFHGSPAAISIAGLDGRFIDVNRAFLRMFGFKREEVINHNILDLNIHFDPRNRQRIVEKLLREKSVSNYEIALRTKNGWQIDVVESLEIVEVAGEKCVLTIWEDITARKRLEKEILDISEREQSRIGQDLHDGVCQNLAGLAFLVEGFAKNLEAGRVAAMDAAAEARNIAKCVRDVIDEAHNLATGLYPVRLEQNGLASGLLELAKDTSQRYLVKCTFVDDDSVWITNNAAATHLYRIAQEAVSNAIKHGRAGTVEISLADDRGQVTLVIRDDGRGIPKKNMHPGMGLKTMTYRARMIGGALEIRPQSPPLKGTVVTVTFLND